MRSPTRRDLLFAGAAAPIAGGFWPGDRAAAQMQDPLKALETSSGGRLGVAALDTASGAVFGRRTEERFPFCSTAKVMVVSAILKRNETERGLLDRRLVYSEADLMPHSPRTQKHVAEGMRVSDLCAAALQDSDNTAFNLLTRTLGGPAAVTAFARSIGDDKFRLDRWETELNEAAPGDPRDTTTPDATVRSLQRLALGDALESLERGKLVEWMKGCTTGAKRIRAGVPADWTVADKTGTGDYGSTNDIAVVWPTRENPLVLAIYFTQKQKSGSARDDVLEAAAKIVVAARLAGQFRRGQTL